MVELSNNLIQRQQSHFYVIFFKACYSHICSTSTRPVELKQTAM